MFSPAAAPASDLRTGSSPPAKAAMSPSAAYGRIAPFSTALPRRKRLMDTLCFKKEYECSEILIGIKGNEPITLKVPSRRKQTETPPHEKNHSGPER